ncbi:hypothetical protein NA56DRAFT_656748 [Hyaloscypha hepaticicola]|uniref:Uncharacterized protein n=1 Tax=Hyaloscypha hepaticicola TaxID=2082293 RepID=A0A2J6QDL1_9HELO|nr:hypothetical protein NA56DRAFT_656748 [Hyaloscypha hepaticicola]
MLYDSVIEKIWVNFIKGGASSTVKRPTPQAFLRVCETFRINEEEDPSSRHLPLEIKSYLAERKIWEHFYKYSLRLYWDNLADRISWQGFGLPWVNSFLSLQMSKLIVKGPKQEYIKQLNRLTPSFELYYERLGENGPLLLWPEFKYKRDIKIRDRGDSRTPIPKAFEKILERPISPNQALPLPVGFDFNLAFSESLTAPAHESSTSLTSSLKRRASTPSDESRGKRRGLGSSVLESSQGLKEDPDEESINGMRSNENQGQTRPGEPFALVRRGPGIGAQSSPRVKEEIEREDEDINNIASSPSEEP